MAEDRLIRAIGRLEQAVARLESRPPKPAADADLAERHRTLRTESEAVLAGLDRLIGNAGG